MANNTGTDLDLVRLATRAVKCSVALYETVGSYQSCVLSLIQETGALADVLQSLTDAAQADTESHTSALVIPLERCAWACQQFEQEIKQFSRSDDGGTTSCDWGRLRYMGDNVGGFSRLLSGYKMIVSIALTFANMYAIADALPFLRCKNITLTIFVSRASQESLRTADDIRCYTQLLSTAKAEFESRLKMIDELDDMPGQNLTGFDSEADWMAQIENERQSAEQCLQICAQFSEYIDMAKLANANRSPKSDNEGNAEFFPVSEESTNDDLEKLNELFSRLKAQQERNGRQQLNLLVEKLTTTSSSSATATAEIKAEFARWSDESESGRNLLDELSSTITKLKVERTLSFFENRGTGDVFQLMVSTGGGGKYVRGRNEGSGWKIRQFGGCASNETVRQVSKDMSSMSFTSAKTSERFSGSADAPESARGGGSWSSVEPKPDVRRLRRAQLTETGIYYAVPGPLKLGSEVPLGRSS